MGIKNVFLTNNTIFIIKINTKNEDNIRNKKDGYDKLNKKINQKIINFIKKECFIRNIDFKIFENDFNKSIRENSIILLKEILK